MENMNKVEYLSYIILLREYGLMHLLKIIRNIGHESSVKAFLVRGFLTSILYSMASVVSLVVKSGSAIDRKCRSFIWSIRN